MTNRDITPEERALFRRTVAGTQRIGSRDGQYIPHEAVPKPAVQVRRPARRGEAALHSGVRVDSSDGGYVAFCRHGPRREVFQQLKLGDFGYADALDLHGCTLDRAERKLGDFLATSGEADDATVLIVHGKDRGSEQPGGVLKPFTVHWLKQQPAVLAFCSALPKDGGTGAVYVLLRGGEGR